MSKSRQGSLGIMALPDDLSDDEDFSVTEVTSARSKLDGVLQNLVEKKEEFSPIKDEDLIVKLEPEDYLTDSAPSTPKKQSAAGKMRKRKRKDDGSDLQPQYHHTYVMKLFDRSVDLAQFDDTTALYPICRAWMRNAPHNQTSRSNTPSPEPILNLEPDIESGPLLSGGKPREVYRLPAPPAAQYSEAGEYVDARVPEPLAQPEDGLDINADPDSAPAPENLLLDHMARWRKVRQSWREASAVNEGRHAASMRILKNMFDYQMEQSQ